MGRLLAIDFGRKRCGIAVTDPLRIVANPLTTVRACDLNAFVSAYVKENGVDKIIVGLPTTLRGEASESQRYLMPAMKSLQKAVPDTPIEFYDERFTSALAHRAMIDGGMKKADRRDKAAVDMISASIILNDYLNSKQNQI
ncbi:MAG: Holliday junction resolvase RuvX [Clostridium sp.]|nr:Holliday junction resolvase RuvX [Clostridium sp.]